MKNPFSSDPVSLNIKPKPLGISKVNRLPVIIVCCCFLLLLIFLVFNFTHKRNLAKQKGENKQDETEVVLSEQPVNDKWFKDPAYDNIRTLAASSNLNEAPTPAISHDSYALHSVSSAINAPAASIPLVSPDPLTQPLSLESQKSLNEAVKSVGLPSESGFSASQMNGLENPYIREGYQAMTVMTNQTNLTDKERFLKENILPGNYLPHMLKDAISPYEIKAGSVIPAALEGGLNSDLPGYLRARVRENVYDTVSGKYILIPQGTVLLGEYQSNVDFGQNRVLVVWTRMIYPNGKSINIEKMSGIDRSGYSGLSDRTNQHWFRIYSSALLMSVMGASYELLTKDDGNQDENSARAIIAAQAGQQMSQVSNEVIRKNLNIAPTIEIRPGHKFYVFVQKDMLLEPWESYEPL